MARSPKTKKATTKRRRAGKKKRPAAAPRSAAERRFARDLLARGEAAPLDKDGRLPSHATHVISDDGDSGPVVKRARFKLY